MNKGRRGMLPAVSALLGAAALVNALLVGAPGPAAAADSPAGPRGTAVPGNAAAALDREQVGRWRVTRVAADRFTLIWRAPAPLPITDARPEFHAGTRVLGHPRLAGDGRTLSLTVGAESVPATAELDVLLSGRVLDSSTPKQALDAGGVRGIAPAPYAMSAPGAALPVDPGTPGPFRVVTSDYRLPAEPIAGMPAPIEMLGHVVRPAGATAQPAPLVLFLHGRHQPCFGRPTGPGRRFWPCPPGTRPVPSHLGYDYAQRLLASQGYVTVSISANGINAQDFLLLDGGSAARASLVRRHLARWARWADAGRFGVDMSRVVLVGHSRGGEGVSQAAAEIPLAAPYRIVGQVLLAPTNFGRRAAAYVPTVTVLPYCDGDVVDLQGQSYTDLARDLTGDDTALHSSVLVMGANHNFFNTEWTPRISVARSFDDGRFLPGRLCKRTSPTRLDAREQRAVGRSYIAGAVGLMAERDATVLPMFDGSNVTVGSAGTADVRTHALGLGRDVRRAGEATLSRTTGARTRLCLGRSGSARAEICGRRMFEIRTPHWVPDFFPDRGALGTRAFEMRWTRAAGTGGLNLQRPLDLRGATSLDLRTAVDPALGGVRLRVRVYDGSGGSAELTARRGKFLPALPGRNPFVFGKVWAQTLRVPLAGAAGVDLSDVRRMELVGASADGRVWVLDLSPHDAQAGLAAVPVRRLPRLDIENVRVREGDGPRERTVQVPLRIQGVVREPARLVVLVFDDTHLRVRRIALAPGQRRATLNVSYTPDRLDDLPRQGFLMVALPVRGVMPSRYFGRLRVVDDDPTPRLRVVRVSRSAREGASARWLVELDRPVDYHVGMQSRVVAGSTTLPRVSTSDVPRQWLREHTFPVPRAEKPLHEARPMLFDVVRPGRTRQVLRVPLRADGVDEPDEAVTLRVRVRRFGDPAVRTVTVLD